MFRSAFWILEAFGCPFDVTEGANWRSDPLIPSAQFRKGFENPKRLYLLELWLLLAL